MDNDKLMKIFGADEIVKAFKELDFKIQDKILTSSFRQASKIILDEAKSGLRGSYTKVAASLGSVMKRNIQTLNVGRVKKGGNLAAIANKGTKERAYKTKNGVLHRTGRVKGTYFWDKANDSSTVSRVEETIYKSVKKEFDKLLQKRIKS